MAMAGLYRRILPSPPAIDFASAEGKVGNPCWIFYFFHFFLFLLEIREKLDFLVRLYSV